MADNANQNINDVDVSKSEPYKGKEILKVLSVSIADDGKKVFKVLFDNGDQGTVPASHFEKEAA